MTVEDLIKELKRIRDKKLPVVIHNQTGLLVHPADSSELATAMVTLLKDPGRRREMGERGLKRVTEHFGVARFLDGTLKAYRRAVERKSSTAALNSSAQPSGKA